MPIILEHSQATVEIGELDGSVRSVQVQPADPKLFVPIRSCTTTYPRDLIELILDVKGPSLLCDELDLDGDPAYGERGLRLGVLSYFDESAFDRTSLLVFGCGCGASMVVLARMFPGLHVVGIEILPEYVTVARARITHHGLINAEVLNVTDLKRLPSQLGQFDFVLLGWQQLLPHERRSALPELWSALKPGGSLLFNQVPFRWSLIETHATGLPLINYLPAPLALRIARGFSKEVSADETWEGLLRRGVRGGTLREILGVLHDQPGRAVLLAPRQHGCRDRIDLWYQASANRRWPLLKRMIRVGLKGIKAVTGEIVLPTVTVAIRKES